MDNKQEYIISSLELHLFFARIMKEHAIFLKLGFLPPSANFAQEGEHLLRQFDMLLSRAVSLSDHIIGSCVLESGELFTEFTPCAEQQTQRLTGTFINRELTAREMRLLSRDCHEELCISPALVGQVQQLNRDALAMVERIIRYKEHLLRCIDTCEMFTTNYPLLIEHILREARLYRSYLMQLEGTSDCSCRELHKTELFWNQIMMEHALFIRGLLDPTEEELIGTANEFAMDYRRLLETSAAAHDRTMRSATPLALTRKFRDFKQAGVQGIEACQIRSLILPLLADHVLREANHYIRLLEMQ